MTDRPAEPGAMPERVWLNPMDWSGTGEQHDAMRAEGDICYYRASLYEQAVKERDEAVAERRKLRAAVKEHLVNLEQTIAALDATCAQPESPARGSRIAQLVNCVEMGKDRLKHFGIGMTLDRPAKSQPANPNLSRLSKGDAPR